jgi:hypothetical protein
MIDAAKTTMRDLTSEEDVFGDAQIRKVLRLLVYEHDTVLKSSVGITKRDLLVVQIDTTAVRLNESSQDSHQGALTGTVLTHQRVNLSRLGDEIDTVQNVGVAERFADRLNANARTHERG